MKTILTIAVAMFLMAIFAQGADARGKGGVWKIDKTHEWSECTVGELVCGKNEGTKTREVDWKCAQKWGADECGKWVWKGWHFVWKGETKTTVKKEECSFTDYSACEEEGVCPTECGYEGGTVPDGEGCVKNCEATEACPIPEPPIEPEVDKSSHPCDHAPSHVLGFRTYGTDLLKWNTRKSAKWMDISAYDGNGAVWKTQVKDKGSFDLTGMPPAEEYKIRAVNRCGHSDFESKISF